MESKSAPSKRRRVLVVDDDLDSATTLALVLGSAGHQVRTATDGTSALQEAARLNPQVALLDLRLGDMTGYELARELRRRHGPETILVALTGLEGEDVELRCREAGFDHYLLKPILDFDAVRALVGTGEAQ